MFGYHSLGGSTGRISRTRTAVRIVVEPRPRWYTARPPGAPRRWHGSPRWHRRRFARRGEDLAAMRYGRKRQRAVVEDPGPTRSLRGPAAARGGRV